MIRGLYQLLIAAALGVLLGWVLEAWVERQTYHLGPVPCHESWGRK